MEEDAGPFRNLNWRYLPYFYPLVNWPRCSMYGIFTYIYPKKCPNAFKYSIYEAYGWLVKAPFFLSKTIINHQTVLLASMQPLEGEFRVVYDCYSYIEPPFFGWLNHQSGYVNHHFDKLPFGKQPHNSGKIHYLFCMGRLTISIAILSIASWNKVPRGYIGWVGCASKMMTETVIFVLRNITARSAGWSNISGT